VLVATASQQVQEQQSCSLRWQVISRGMHPPSAAMWWCLRLCCLGCLHV